MGAVYPETPASQGGDTSRAAALAILPRAGTLQAVVLATILHNGPKTSFEIARLTGKSYRSIQPRTAELRAMRRIMDSGLRRTDPETGKDAIVWRLV